ncbi:MAG: TMEM165/GDT1 family protein, partial [Polyangiaceae bacterium]
MPSLVVFASVFGVIFLAELPDKTALTTFVMATRHRALPVFVGAAAALAIQSLVAVLAGALLGKLPAHVVHMAAGLLFLVTAVLMWRQAGEEEADPHEGATKGFARTAWVVFGVVFLAEWGDLT